MNPGRDLDKLIAEKVFGRKTKVVFNDWHYEVPSQKCGSDIIGYVPVPRYSIHMACAMDVATKVNQLGYSVGLFIATESGFRARLANGSEVSEATSDENLAHAICLAALKAVNAL